MDPYCSMAFFASNTPLGEFRSTFIIRVAGFCFFSPSIGFYGERYGWAFSFYRFIVLTTNWLWLANSLGTL